MHIKSVILSHHFVSGTFDVILETVLPPRITIPENQSADLQLKVNSWARIHITNRRKRGWFNLCWKLQKSTVTEIWFRNCMELVIPWYWKIIIFVYYDVAVTYLSQHITAFTSHFASVIWHISEGNGYIMEKRGGTNINLSGNDWILKKVGITDQGVIVFFFLWVW